MFNQLDSRSVTFNLIMINILMYVISQMQIEFMYSHFALFYPASQMFMPVQLITHMFMHDPIHGEVGILHIVFNMYALFMFGIILERVWGPKKFLFFYLFTGLGAAFLHLLVQGIIIHNFTGSFAPSLEMLKAFPDAANIYSTRTFGASGAVFGILAAFALLFPNTELLLMFIPVPIKAKYLIGVYILVEVYLGFSMRSGDNTAHFAHLGGALFGFLLVKYWNRNRNSLY